MRYDTNDVTIDDLRALAIGILRQEPDPPVRVRLLRDVLCAPSGDDRLIAACDGLSAWAEIAALESEQRDDGSWGRIHSRDTKVRQRYPTTEYAVERATALGLSSDHAMLTRAAEYLAGVITGQRQPLDPPEKNDRWGAGVQLFAAATLARINSSHPALDKPWAVWSEVLDAAFANGVYDAQAEAEAQLRLHGATIEDSYLILSSRYALTLLSARAGELRQERIDPLLTWIGQRADGIGYLGERLDGPPQKTPGRIERWIQSWEILSRFPLKPRRARELLDLLDETSDEDGFWDYGERASNSAVFPLSANWRKRGTRRVDWTTRLLVLESALVR